MPHLTIIRSSQTTVPIYHTAANTTSEGHYNVTL